MEWILTWATVALTALVIVRGAPRHRALAVALVALVCIATGVAALGWSSTRTARARSRDELEKTTPRVGRPGGYVSSSTCRSCHPSEHASWHRSFHRTMTQLATPDAVKGRFDGVRLTHQGHAYTLERTGDAFFVRVDDAEPRRVTMVTGSHHMQAYWLHAGEGNAQTELPLSYLVEDARWVPRRDVFLMSPEVEKTASIWNETCIECHTTAGQPRLDLPSHAPETRVVEMGIACEACHGPARQHVEANQNPIRRAWLHATGRSDSTIVNPARLDAERATQVCGQCHGVACTLEGSRGAGLAFAPGEDLEQVKPLVRLATVGSSPCKDVVEQEPAFLESRFWSDGMVRVSGREHNALVGSACFRSGKLSCLSCHSMHDSNPDDQLARGMEGNRACLGCHDSMRADPSAHTRHAPDSAGSLCYNCHMPYTTYGLLKAIRSHTIDRPSVVSTIETGRPNACNLCHLDKSLGWAADQLATMYGVTRPPLGDDADRIAASVQDVLTGDAGQRALAAWSMGWSAATEASGTDWVAPYLAELLDDRYAAVRYVASRSLRRLPGFAAFSYDYLAPPGEQVLARDRALAAWRKATRSGRAAPSVLVDGSGNLVMADWERLSATRDNPNMVLAE